MTKIIDTDGIEYGPQSTPDDPRIWKGSVSEFFLQGLPAQLEYLPTPKSTKWRKASATVKSFGPVFRDYGEGLKIQEGWHAIRFVKYEY